MHNQKAFFARRPGAVIVAAGAGSRFGGSVAKQFVPVAGKPTLLWSLEALLQTRDLVSVVIVAPPGQEDQIRQMLPHGWNIHVVSGGATRNASVRAGLDALCVFGPDCVLIHDAARPGLTPDVISELVSALEHADAAAPALPLADALKRAEGDEVRSVSRDHVVRIQTPQAFRWPVIEKAFAQAADPAVDDLSLVEAQGVRIALTRGRHELMKITYAEDIPVVEKLIAGASARVGTGFDVHAFEPGHAVILCGIEIPHTHKLEGHSDADVAWHALTDAILGALALGDIGDHFPPSDPQWKGAPSVRFLEHAVRLAHDRGFRVANADITILAERPKISPFREQMRISSARALAVDVDAVSVKATTTEKLGFIGRGEGIAAQASVLMTR